MQDHNLSSFSLYLNIIAPLSPTLTHQKQELLQGWGRASVRLQQCLSPAALISVALGDVETSCSQVRNKWQPDIGALLSPP